jgi:hypothetical protein
MIIISLRTLRASGGGQYTSLTLQVGSGNEPWGVWVVNFMKFYAQTTRLEAQDDMETKPDVNWNFFLHDPSKKSIFLLGVYEDCVVLEIPTMRSWI